MKKPYVHSSYARKQDDDYKTIDPRCVQALMETFPVWGIVADCCAPSGSGIVDQLEKYGFQTYGVDDAFSDFFPDWVVTNPPYKKNIVDKIVWRQIERLQDGHVNGLAILVRNNWDFAKTRYKMFTHQFYTGQIHMMFRPLWIEGKPKHSPIHNYVWHIWTVRDITIDPFVKYWRQK